jgi:hypothetical protein
LAVIADPHPDPHTEMPEDDKRPSDAKSGGLFVVFMKCLGLHHLGHHLAHSDSCGILRLTGGMRVGEEREAGIVVAQHGGSGLHIHAILKGGRCECVPKFVKF